MSENACNHEFITGLDGIPRCRKCGQIGGKHMEELGIFWSLKQARRVMDEIAVSGNYRPDEVGPKSVIYRRSNGIQESLYIIKKADRQWCIIKEIKVKE